MPGRAHHKHSSCSRFRLFSAYCCNGYRRMVNENVYPVDISIPHRLNVYLDWQSRAHLICEFLLQQMYIRGQIPEPFATMCASHADVDNSGSNKRVRQSKSSREMAMFIKSINELKESIHKFCEYQSLRNCAVDTACVMFGVSPRAPKEMYYVHFRDNDENDSDSNNDDVSGAVDTEVPTILALSDSRNAQLFNKVKRKMLRTACTTSMGMSTDSNSTENENENKQNNGNKDSDQDGNAMNAKGVRGVSKTRLNRKAVQEKKRYEFSLDAIPESSLRAVHIGLRCSLSSSEDELGSAQSEYPVQCRQMFQWIRKFSPKIWKRKTIPLLIDVHVQSVQDVIEEKPPGTTTEGNEGGKGNKRTFDAQGGEWFVQKKKIKTLYRK